MATFRDYTEGVLVNSGPTESFTADSAIKMGQIVKQVAGTERVAPTNTNGERALGIAIQTKAAGEQVTVALPGSVVRATSGTGTVSATDLVTPYGTTNGSLQTAASGDWAIGTALKDDSGSNDDLLMLISPWGYFA